MSIDELNFYLEKTLNENPLNIAHLLKYLYKDTITFDGKQWYSFNNETHGWKITEEHNNPLTYIIKGELINKYMKLANEYNLKVQEINNLSNDNTTTYYPLIINDLIYKSKICAELSLKLNNDVFCNQITAIAKELFIEKDFSKTMDLNPSLMGFNNGIYDLSKHQFEVNQYMHKVIMSTGYNFPIQLAYYNDVIKFFDMLKLTDLLPTISYLLHGDRRLPFIWVTGLTDNTLNALLELFLWTLGDYAGTMTFADLRRRKISDNGTQVDLVKNCQQRIVFVEQREEDQPNVCSQMIETLLYQYYISLRKPREKTSSTYHPQFGLVVLSCHPKTEPWKDAAVFKSEPNEDSMTMYSKEEWKSDLIQILLEYWKKSNEF